MLAGEGIGNYISFSGRLLVASSACQSKYQVTQLSQDM